VTTDQSAPTDHETLLARVDRLESLDQIRQLEEELRLALAAKRSVGWDPIKGRPRRGDINGFVRALVNDGPIYHELSSIFRQSGLRLQVVTVEKVLVSQAGQLAFFDELKAEGVRPGERVPFDCQTWFSVRPEGGARE
jgi:hypothetical protein